MENAPQLEEDIPFCARESVLDVVPRLVTLHETAAEISA
jgi:phosphosulfolactate phosphohydrolase-like enzyme